jgi:hypothetical protein
MVLLGLSIITLFTPAARQSWGAVISEMPWKGLPWSGVSFPSFC